MRRALLGAILLVLFGSVPAWAEAPAAAPIVTPVQAGGILDDIWNHREDALNQRNRPALASLEEGPALANDLAWMDGLVPFRPGLLGRRGLVGQVVVVPRLLSYPAYFVASTRVTNAPDPTRAYSYWTALLVVVRDDQASPWRIRLESWAADPAHAEEVERVLATDQPERFAPPPQALGSSLDSLPDRLSRVFSSHAAQPIAHNDVFTIGLWSGSQLVCFARAYVQSENRPWWNPAKASAKDDRGIPEGAYQKLISTVQKQQCGLIDPDTSAGFTVLTSETEFVSHQEVPQSPPPWLPVAIAGMLLTLILTAAVWKLRPAPPSDLEAPTPEVVTLPDLERKTVLMAALRVLMVALILIEVERWLLPRSPWFAALLAIGLLVHPVSMLLPARRTIRFTGRILVKRPLAEVFDFIRDQRNEPKWQPLIVGVTALPSSSEAIRLYRTRQRIAPDLLLEYESRVTEPAGQQVIAADILGKWFPGRAQWRLRAIPDGTVVTLARWFEVGPLRAISRAGLEQFRQGLRQMTLSDLEGVNRCLTEGTPPAGPDQPQVEDRQISAQYGWLRRLPIIGHSDIGISIASFIACWVLYSRLTTDWFATGIMVMLLVHELGHYVEGRRVGLTARPPVFILGGAFVYFPGAKIDGLAHARLSLAGGLAGGLATAVALGLYVVTGSSHLLAWVLAGAAANLFGSLLPFVTLDVEAILMAVGKWLPAVGVVAALAAGAAALALGVGDIIIPLIVFLAFVVLRLRYPGRRHPDLGGLTGRARLVIAGSWLALVLYLSVVFFLTAGWLT